MRRFLPFLSLIPGLLLAEEAVVPGSRVREPMVDLAEFAPRIVVELRYATTRNIAKRPIYPKGARAFLREGVAKRLLRAQHWLDENAPRGTRIKVWDAWRPAQAHKVLWEIFPNAEFLGDPAKGGSLHTWGACVDATLVDRHGRELRMPTDFDVFTPAAKTFYSGSDPVVAKNLRYLQYAMSKGGFMVVHDEWWHFVATDYRAYGAIDLSLTK